MSHQFPRVFAHGSRQLGDITTEMFDIVLTIKDGEHPPCLQKKAYPTSPQRKNDTEANIQEFSPKVSLNLWGSPQKMPLSRQF